jgi:hypothetical protein
VFDDAELAPGRVDQPEFRRHTPNYNRKR